MNNKLIDLYLENPLKFKNILSSLEEIMDHSSKIRDNRMLNLFLKYLCNK